MNETGLLLELHLDLSSFLGYKLSLHDIFLAVHIHEIQVMWSHDLIIHISINLRSVLLVKFEVSVWFHDCNLVLNEILIPKTKTKLGMSSYPMDGQNFLAPEGDPQAPQEKKNAGDLIETRYRQNDSGLLRFTQCRVASNFSINLMLIFYTTQFLSKTSYVTDVNYITH